MSHRSAESQVGDHVPYVDNGLQKCDTPEVSQNRAL